MLLLNVSHLVCLAKNNYYTLDLLWSEYQSLLIQIETSITERSWLDTGRLQVIDFNRINGYSPH